MNAGVCFEPFSPTLSSQFTSSGPFKGEAALEASREQKRRPLLPRSDQSVTPVERAINRSGKRLKSLGSVVTVAVLSILSSAHFAAAAESGDPMAKIKGYLVSKLERMDAAGHDFVADANAYQAIIDKSAGDYDRAALEDGPELLQLISKMQEDYRVYHNHGYETIEGITAGTKAMVAYDTYLDGGVAKSEASTDSPYSPMVLKTRDGRMISDRNGNLFHYVIEPALWGTKPQFVKKLSPAAAEKLKPVLALPLADVLTASADECALKLDELLAIAKAWQPTMDECVGALVWMTPTLNGYFDDWKNSRYDPVAAQGRYVAESRVLDMQGIMYSLALVCDAILPRVKAQNPALAKQLKYEYDGILNFLKRVDDRDQRGERKMSIAEIEELALQAKTLTDQLDPHLRQLAAVLNLRIPPKPTLS
jgi:Imelysin